MPPLAALFSGAGELSPHLTGGASGGISTGAITNGITTVTFPAQSQASFWIALAALGAGAVWLMIRK